MDGLKEKSVKQVEEMHMKGQISFLHQDYKDYLEKKEILERTLYQYGLYS